MFLKIARLLFFFFLFWNQTARGNNTPQNFITYEFSGGRFGDNLLAYLHAKWLSHSSKIPLVYKPFDYSSLLQLHDAELNDSLVDLRQFKTKQLSGSLELTSNQTLYICPYFPESQWERMKTRGPHGDKWFYFDVPWKDPVFREIAKKMISPKNKLSLTIPPEGKVAIAIHVRNGGGFDMSDAGLRNPTKFPPIAFYTKALEKVISLFRGYEMYCFVFTDAENPSPILEEIKQSVPNDIPITFDCRSQNNRHNLNVLEDFYSLFEFDVLIHPESNFSLIPTLLQDYAISCCPASGFSVKSTITIDLVHFKINELIFEKVKEKCIPN